MKMTSLLLSITSLLTLGTAFAVQPLFVVPNGASPDAEPYFGKTYVFSATNGGAPVILGLISENQQGVITHSEHETIPNSFLQQPPFSVNVTVIPGKPSYENLLIQHTSAEPVRTGVYQSMRMFSSLDVISFLINDHSWEYQG